jgi:hypothetical protein
MSHAAITTATTPSCTSVSQSSAYASGTLSSTTNRTTSAPIITGRLRRRSTHGPSGIATSAPAASPHAASADTAAGPASSARIAINGNASNASHVPAVLTANAAQSHANWRSGKRTIKSRPPDA